MLYACFSPQIVSGAVTIAVVETADGCSEAATLLLGGASYCDAGLNSTAGARIAVKWNRWQAVFPTRSAFATVALTAAAASSLPLPRKFDRLHPSPC